MDINYIVSLLTFISNIVFVLFILLMFIRDFRLKVFSFVSSKINLILFVLSFGAVAGSLIYSEIVGFPPCNLCWWQRVFMYPIPLLALIAWIKKDKGITDYVLPMSIVGAFIAFYHSLVQWGFNVAITNCTIGDEAECGKLYVYEFGYITIPFMALSIFVYLIVVSLIHKKSLKN